MTLYDKSCQNIFLIDANMNTNFWTNQILLMRPDPIYSLSVTSEFNTNSLNGFNNIRNHEINYNNSTLKQNYIGESNNKNYKPKLNSYPGVGLKDLAQNTVCIHSGKKVDIKENSMLSVLNIHHIHCNNCVDLKQCQLSQSLRVIKPYLRDITNPTNNSTINKFCLSNVEQSSSRLTHSELKCPIIACKYAPKCLHLMHECKLAEHLAYTCPHNLVNCPNRENGCIQKLARERISSHLQHCPCSVVCCTFKWVRKLLPNIELLQKPENAEFKLIPYPTKESKFGAVKRNWMKPISFTHTKSSNNNFGNHDVLDKKKLNQTPQEGEELEWSNKSIICSCCNKMNVNHNSLDEAIRQEIYYSPNSGVIKFSESNFRNSMNKCNNKILGDDYHDKRVTNNHLQNYKILPETFGSKNSYSDKLMLRESPLDEKQINLYSTKDNCPSPSVSKNLIKNPETTLALDEYLRQRDQITFLRQNPQIIGIRNNVNQNANDEQIMAETLKQTHVKQEKSINECRHRRSRSLYEHLLAKRAENSIHACRRASLASAYNLNPKNPKNISNCNTNLKEKNDIILSYSKRTIKSLNPIPSNVITGLLQPINIKFSLPFHHSKRTDDFYCKDDDKNTCEINHAKQHCMDNQGCIANCNESTKSLLKTNDDIQLDGKLNSMLKTTSSKSYNCIMNGGKKINVSANCNADNENTNNNINVTNFTSLYENNIDFKTNNKNNEINNNSAMFNTNHICNHRENKSNRAYHHDKVKQLTINPPLFLPSPHSFSTDFKNKSSVTNNATLESDKKISNDDFLGRQIHSVARYGLYAGKMQEFCCGQCVRRDTFAQHYESVHCEIESYLDDWMIHRCPLALSHHNTLSFNDNANANSSQTTCCNFYVDRLIPCMAQQPGSITYNLSAQSFRFRPTPLAISNPTNSIDLKTMQSKVRRTEHKLAAMDTLPWELILAIVQNLEASDLIQLSLVNHFFHNLIQCYILPHKGCIVNVWARSHNGAKGSKWLISKQKWILPKTFGKLSGWKINPLSTSGLIAKHLQSCPLNITNKQETPFQYPVNLTDLNPYCSSVVERPGDWLLNAPSTSKSSHTGLSTSSSYYIPKTLRYMEQLDPSIVNFTNNHNGKVLYHNHNLNSLSS